MGKNKKEAVKKPFTKKWWFWLLVILVVGGIFSNIQNNRGNTVNTLSTPEPTENQSVKTDIQDDIIDEDDSAEDNHLYDDATVKDVMNGFRTEKLGEYSIVYIDSSLVTEENMNDWYFNYVSQNNFNWCMILYTDKNDNSGVYAVQGMVQKDILFEEDEYGDYMVGDSSNSTVYVPTEDNTLKELMVDNIDDQAINISADQFVEEVRTVIQGAISSKDEAITDVVLKDGDLCVCVDFSKASPTFITLEDLALSRTSSITDAILELTSYDSLWETITVDFGEIGHITNHKSNMKSNGFGRYFPAENFKLDK